MLKIEIRIYRGCFSDIKVKQEFANYPELTTELVEGFDYEVSIDDQDVLEEDDEETEYDHIELDLNLED